MGHPAVLPSPSLRYLGLLLLLTPLIGGMHLLASREPAPRIVTQIVDVPYVVYLEAPAPNPVIERFPAGPVVTVEPSSVRQDKLGGPSLELSIPSERLTGEAAPAPVVFETPGARLTPGVGIEGAPIVVTIGPAVAPMSGSAGAGTHNSPPDTSTSPADPEGTQAPIGATIMADGTNLAAPVVWTIVVDGTTLAAPVVSTPAPPSAGATLPQTTSVPTASKRHHDSDSNSNDNRHRESVNDSRGVVGAASSPPAGPLASVRPTVTPAPRATKTPKTTPTAKEALNRMLLPRTHAP